MNIQDFERSLQHAAANLLVAAERRSDGLSADMKALAARLQIMALVASRSL